MLGIQTTNSMANIITSTITTILRNSSKTGNDSFVWSPIDKEISIRCKKTSFAMDKSMLGIIVFTLFVIESDAATPLFLKAITSALATIPFSGGPMTTGLVGAKLGIGTKLLYYLGYFGRKKPSAPKKHKQLPTPDKLQPLPYSMLEGSQFASNFQPQYGVDPAQLFQALTAQGVDPNVALEAINYAGGMNTGFPVMSGFNPNFPPNMAFPPKTVPVQEFSRPGLVKQAPVSEDDGSDDAESFFTFMQDMDENSCISRLICDIGNEPSFLGDFSENIHNMVGSLKVPSTSRAFQYIEIMEKGREEGRCGEKFLDCSDTSYEVVKNVAPSVTLPQNVDAINNL